MDQLVRWFGVVFVAGCLAGFMPRELRAAAVDCVAPDSAQQSNGADSAGFWAYRFDDPFTSLRYRDLEFLWDPISDGEPSPELRATLRGFASTLVDSFGRNPFGADISDFNLMYTYFRNLSFGLPYTLDPEDSVSVHFGTQNLSYNPSDRSHVDVYLFHPSRTTVDGRYPSAYESGEEDLSTGHSADAPKVRNSLMMRAPTGEARLDLTGTGWTAPDGFQNVVFNHEFRHGLPGRRGDGVLGEMFSAFAEAVGGNRSLELIDEFPYTWSLFGFIGSPSCTNLRLTAATTRRAAHSPRISRTTSVGRTRAGRRPALRTTWPSSGTQCRLHRWQGCGLSSSTTVAEPARPSPISIRISPR